VGRFLSKVLRCASRELNLLAYLVTPRSRIVQSPHSISRRDLTAQFLCVQSNTPCQARYIGYSGLESYPAIGLCTYTRPFPPLDSNGSSQSVRKLKMPYVQEDELHESFANNPSSLEGRLLFAVPKSESTRSLAWATG
jgi:hypothetical protein